MGLQKQLCYIGAIYAQSTFGTVGYAIRGVEAKIVDEDGRRIRTGARAR